MNILKLFLFNSDSRRALKTHEKLKVYFLNSQLGPWLLGLNKTSASIPGTWGQGRCPAALTIAPVAFSKVVMTRQAHLGLNLASCPACNQEKIPFSLNSHSHSTGVSVPMIHILPWAKVSQSICCFSHQPAYSLKAEDCAFFCCDSQYHSVQDLPHGVYSNTRGLKEPKK